jgi:hypothetical protein
MRYWKHEVSNRREVKYSRGGIRLTEDATVSQSSRSFLLDILSVSLLFWEGAALWGTLDQVTAKPFVSFILWTRTKTVFTDPRLYLGTYHSFIHNINCLIDGKQ